MSALKIAIEQMAEDLTELDAEIAFCDSYIDHYSKANTVTPADRELAVAFWESQVDDAVAKFIELWEPYTSAAGYAA